MFVICENEECRKMFNREPHKLKENKHNFCSKECYEIIRKRDRYYPKSIDKTLFHKIQQFAKMRGE